MSSFTFLARVYRGQPNTARIGTLSALLVFVLGVGTPRTAVAADAPSDEAAVEQRRTEAKSKYQAGVDAYERRRYKDAVEHFLAADRLAPSAPLSFNIARAYERLGDDTSALRWYRDYLRRNPAAVNAESVAETVRKLALALSTKGVQQLSVLSTPAGATVSIDDQPVGVTPWTGELPPGKHRVLLSLRGHADAERELDLAASEPLDLSVRMDPASPLPAPSSAPTLSAPLAPASAATASLDSPQPATPGKQLGIWPWVTLGAGAATLGGSLAFELLRRSAESDAKQEPTQLGYQSALDTVESRKQMARVLLGVGGAVVIAGGVMLLLDSGSSQAGARVGLGCVPEGCALGARGAF
jgi:tetratricopeptide (TPR) repeat protein